MGRVLGKGSQKGACYGFYSKAGFREGFSEGVLRTLPRRVRPLRRPDISGPLDGGVQTRGGSQFGLVRPYFIRSCPFWDFPVFFRDFPDLSFSSFLAYKAPTRNFPESVRDSIRTPQFSFSQVGDGPNTVSESTVSNTKLSEFFYPHRAPGRELSEFLATYYLCAKANSPSFCPQNSPSLAQNCEFSLPKQDSGNSGLF